MLFSILNTLYHVWAYESELGLRYGDACRILCKKYYGEKMRKAPPRNSICE